MKILDRLAVAIALLLGSASIRADSLESILAYFEKHSSAPLIIRLKTNPAVVPETLLTSQQVTAQRALIQAAQQDFVSRYQVSVLGNIVTVPYVITSLDEAGVNMAFSDPAVTAVELDSVLSPSLDISVPKIGGQKDGIQEGGAGFGSVHAKGAGRMIAILDTGVQSTHDFFPSGTVKTADGACFSYLETAGLETTCANGTPEQISSGAAEPCAFKGCEHGTHVAGIAAGRRATFTGVASGATILPIKVVSRDPADTQEPGKTTKSSINRALEWLNQKLSENPNAFPTLSAVNISFNLKDASNLFQGNCFVSATPHNTIGLPKVGAYTDGSMTTEEVRNLSLKGIPVVVATGNNGFHDSTAYPACIPRVIAVGATAKTATDPNDPKDYLWFGTTQGTNLSSVVDLVAPGAGTYVEPSNIQGGICSSIFATTGESLATACAPDLTGFGMIAGTSMSAPHVSGALAVIRGTMPTNAPATWIDTAKLVLKSTGKAIYESSQGITYKRIQVGEAVDLLTPLTGLSASSGAAGSEISITGTHLKATAGAPMVLFGNAPVTQFPEGSTSTNLKVIVPPSGDASPVNVIVTVDGYTRSLPAAFTYSAGTAPTATTIETSASPIDVGQSVTLTATVTPHPVAGQAAGTITFKDTFRDSTTDLATATPSLVDGTATLTTSSLLRGTHSIRAVYSGTSLYSPSNSPTFAQDVQPVAGGAPTVNTLSATPPSAVTGQPVTLTAEVMLTGGGTATNGPVDFYNGGAYLGRATVAANGRASLDLQNGFPVAAAHPLRAEYGGYSGTPAYRFSDSPTLYYRVNAPQSGCPASGPTLCLITGNRFHVQVSWRNPYDGGTTGVGTAAAITGNTGDFWFFTSTNIELVVKILDGFAVNGHWWVAYAALSDVEYTITVADLQTGAQKSYFNAARNLASVIDVNAFNDTMTSSLRQTISSTDLGPGAIVLGSPDGRFDLGALEGLRIPNEHGTFVENPACVTFGSTLCVNDSRFAVSVSWLNPYDGGSTGTGTALNLTPDTGYFWFFESSNVELILKILDGRAVNGHFWLFSGALSDVQYTITARDTQTGAVKTYFNPPRTLSSFIDIAAF